LEEKQAVILLKSGDISGLKVLVELYQTKAVKIAALITGDTENAKDIVQNAFIKISEKIYQFDSKRPFGPWFFRIVTNDSIKAIKRKPKYLSIDENYKTDCVNLIDPYPLPEELIENNLTKQLVRYALAELSPKLRAVIVLRYFLGMKDIQIAKALKSPLGTVKWRLHTARNHLEQLLNSNLEPISSKIESDDQEI
jgi:RNA polymerase sigma-70 factor (ECF subfamily)